MKMTALGLSFCVLLSMHFTNTDTAETIINGISHSNTTINRTLNKLGNHIIAEFMGCTNLNNYDEIESLLRTAAQAANANVLGIVKHQFKEYVGDSQFNESSPMGMSCLALLQESHISIHTWPEFDYVSIDIHTCGEHVDTDAALNVLKDFFIPKYIDYKKLDRGFYVYDSSSIS